MVVWLQTHQPNSPKELYTDFQWIILKDSLYSKPVRHPFENPGVFVQSRDQRSTGGKCRQMHVASVQVEFKVLSLCCCLKKASTIRNSDNRDLLSSITSGCRQLLFLWSRGMGSDYLVTIIAVAKFIYMVTFLTDPPLFSNRMKITLKDP